MNQKKQTEINLLFNLAGLIVNIAIGLFYTPYLVHSLGIAAYGIVPLALIINQYVGVLTTSLTGALTRFYTLALQRNKTTEASKYLSTSFLAITVIIGIISPAFILLILRIDSFFNIPSNYVEQSRNLFIFTILGFIISLYTSLLNITLYALNRLDLINIIKIIRSVLAVTLTVIYFEKMSKDVSYIGYAIFLAELVVLILSILYFLRIKSLKVNLSIRHFEKAALISVVSMSAWVMIHQIGDTGLYRIDNILVNKFWSTRESGILGAVTQFGTYVMLMVGVVTTLFGPLILIAYSNNDHNRVKKLALSNALLVGLLTALMVGLIAGFSKTILSLWLGEEFNDYYNWFAMKLIPLPFYAAAGVFAFVYRAWNKVILPAIATLLIGGINLITSYILCSISNGNENYILMVLIAASIFIVIQSFGLNSFAFLKVYPEISKYIIAKIFIKILVSLLLTIFMAYTYNYFIEVNSVAQLLLGSLIIGLTLLILGYFVMLNAEQKQILSNYMLYFKSNRSLK